VISISRRHGKTAFVAMIVRSRWHTSRNLEIPHDVVDATLQIGLALGIGPKRIADLMYDREPVRAVVDSLVKL
jgi:hypothetical protein